MPRASTLPIRPCLLVAIASLVVATPARQAVAQAMQPTFGPTTAALPSDMILMSGDPASPGLPQTAIHGYLSTGVSTHGGRDVEGGAVIPLLPGEVTLLVGGGTGQLPVTIPTSSGRKNQTLTLSSYQAELQIRPSNDLRVDLAIAGSHVRGPALTSFGP